MRALFVTVTFCGIIMSVLDIASGKSPADSLQLAFLTLIAAKVWGKEDV